MTLNLYVGAEVLSREQPCGTLSKFVVDPDKRIVTSFILDKGFWLLKHSHILPTSTIEEADGETICISIDGQELSRYPEYREITVEEPMPGMQMEGYTFDGMVAGPPISTTVSTVRKRLRRGIPDEHVIIDAHTRIESASSTIGNVDHVLIDAFTDEVIHVIARRYKSAERYIIPSRKIESMGEKRIRVTLSDVEMATLPRYHPNFDAAIRETLENRLYTQEPPVFRNIQIAVTHNVPRLTGRVASVAIKYHAEEMARAINGVIDVQNELTVGHFMSGATSGIHVPTRAKQSMKTLF